MPLSHMIFSTRDVPFLVKLEHTLFDVHVLLLVFISLGFLRPNSLIQISKHSYIHNLHNYILGYTDVDVYYSGGCY